MISKISQTLYPTRILKFLFFAFLIVILTDSADAHVKWFVEFDISEQPLPIGEVIDKTFVYMFIVSVIACYLFFLADRYIYEEGYLAEFDKKLKMFDGAANYIMRGATGLFFFSLFLWWALGYGDSFFITPELVTKSPVIPWVHLLIALCVISVYSTPVTGIGIFFLWFAGVSQYGLYHMLDYPIFLGIAYYLTVSGIKKKGWLKSAFIVLFACTGITLIWASVEKFAYADWTNPVFEKSPHMLMGMSATTFMKLSGFMEFFVTFILLGAVSVVGRLISLGLMSIFVLAVFEFGMVDAIGHLMIVAILFVLIVRGPTDARNMLVLPDKSLFTEAYFMTGLYYLAFVTIILLYYGLHYLFFAPYLR
jgi:hypothetical protein